GSQGCSERSEQTPGGGGGAGVASCVPGVALRSTPGYRRAPLRGSRDEKPCNVGVDFRLHAIGDGRILNRTLPDRTSPPAPRPSPQGGTMPAGRRIRFPLAALLMVAMVQMTTSGDIDPAKQRDAQKVLQNKLDTMARRAGSTIDAMVYQRPSPSAEQKMLEEVADSLKGLSESQIRQVLEHLDAAIKAPDEATSTKEQREAYQKHRQIISQLRGMVIKLDVVENLDEAAARLDRAAARQLDLHG